MIIYKLSSFFKFLCIFIIFNIFLFFLLKVVSSISIIFIKNVFLGPYKKLKNVVFFDFYRFLRKNSIF